MRGNDSYLAIDIGGSKTLLAAFSRGGEIIGEHKFATNVSYAHFLSDLRRELKASFADNEFLYCACAIPGIIDRRRGIGKDFGNLKWHNVPIKKDLAEIIKAPVVVENDANLAGLSEALLVQKKYKKVLYLTISTGIGDGIIINGVIDPELADSEAGQMLLEHEGKLKKWEDFASGRALREKYGKLASEIDDASIWKRFADGIAAGLGELLAIIQPEVVIIGGGVGTHYRKFGRFLEDAMKRNETDMVKVPPIIQAKRPEEAVIYGCYDLTRQTLEKK